MFNLENGPLYQKGKATGNCSFQATTTTTTIVKNNVIIIIGQALNWTWSCSIITSCECASIKSSLFHHHHHHRKTGSWEHDEGWCILKTNPKSFFFENRARLLTSRHVTFCLWRAPNKFNVYPFQMESQEFWQVFWTLTRAHTHVPSQESKHKKNCIMNINAPCPKQRFSCFSCEREHKQLWQHYHNENDGITSRRRRIRKQRKNLHFLFFPSSMDWPKLPVKSANGEEKKKDLIKIVVNKIENPFHHSTPRARTETPIIPNHSHRVHSRWWSGQEYNQE